MLNTDGQACRLAHLINAATNEEWLFEISAENVSLQDSAILCRSRIC